MPLESGVAGEVEFAFGVVVDLHYAASPGRAGLLQELRERGVSVDATNDWGATVLLIAAGSGHTDFRKVSSPLLWRGLSADFILGRGWTWTNSGLDLVGAGQMRVLPGGEHSLRPFGRTI